MLVMTFVALVSRPCGVRGNFKHRYRIFMIRYEIGTASTQGARAYQEDAALYWPGGAGPFSSIGPQPVLGEVSAVAVLADGMGGHAGGALASRLVCENFLNAAFGCKGSFKDILNHGLDAANAAIAAKVAGNPLLNGMGSTLIGALFTDRGLAWVSVGDSPLLVFDGDRVLAINDDHSFAPQLDDLVRRNVMTEAEALDDPRRHILRSAVTGDELDLVDLVPEPRELKPGEIVILASDGIAALPHGTIATLLTEHGEAGAGIMAQRLIRAIDDKRLRQQDNATVIVVKAAA